LMNHAEFQLRGISDPRLAVHATSVHPAWLWSIDGKRILWANPVGAALFKADNAVSLAEKIFGPADAQRRQVARLAGTLPPSGAMRLERLRGFGAALGTLVTCGCARLDFADGGHGILIAGVEANGRTMPLAERLRRLVARIDAPVAALTRDGAFVGASEAARSLLDFGSLSEVGLDDSRIEALRQGRFETPVGTGHLVLQRVGSGADIGLVVLIPPGATPATAATEPPAFDDERPATSAQAPAEFALIDEFLEPPAQAAVEPTAPDQPPEPDIGHADTIAEPSPAPAQHPLRFTWRIDAEGRFSLDAGEFTRLIGASERRTGDIDLPALDPHGRLATAIATHDIWSGITVNWPVDGGGHLPVELSGLPLRDRAENFAGYRGFGVCRDLEGLAHLAASPRTEFPGNSPTPSTVIVQPNSADIVEKGPGDSPAADPPAKPDVASSDTPLSPAPDSFETSQQTDLETAVETPEESPEEAPTEESREAARNVLPFRPISEPKCPALTSVENSAFNELARQLSVRLDSENGAAVAAPATPEATPAVHEPGIHELALPEPPSERPDWLEPAETPARGESRRDRALLDLLPVGVLIYRLDRLVYANRAFLSQLGYDGLHALEDAGGLDALYVEPGISSASSTSDAGKPVRISGTEVSSQHPPVAIDARLFTISWDGDPALALIFSDTPTPAARPCQRRGARRDPRYHGRRHPDVRCRRQHPFVQPQRRGAVRLRWPRTGATQSHRAVCAGKPACSAGISVGHQGSTGRKPARSRPRRAGPRAQGRHHPAVDHHGTRPARSPEFLRGVWRTSTGQKKPGQDEAGCATRRSHGRRQGRSAGADQP
jgi:PAS domain-containing protein